MHYRGIEIEFTPPLGQAASERELPEALAVQDYIQRGFPLGSNYRSITDGIQVRTIVFKKIIDWFINPDVPQYEAAGRLAYLIYKSIGRETIISFSEI